MVKTTMKVLALGQFVTLAGTLALCPIRVQAQGVVEYGTATSAAGTLGAKIGSTLGSAVGGMNKQSSQTLLKAPLNSSSSPPKVKQAAKSGKTSTPREASTSSHTGPNTLHLNSTPANAAIYIDNVAAGTTPANLTLSKGIHTIELRREGYAPWRKNVLLTEGETLTFSPALQDPKNARPMFTVQR